MFHQQRFCNDRSRTTRSQQSGQGRQEMYEEQQNVTHELRSYCYHLGLQVYEIVPISRDNRNSPGTREIPLGDSPMQHVS